MNRKATVTYDDWVDLGCELVVATLEFEVGGDLLIDRGAQSVGFTNAVVG